MFIELPNPVLVTTIYTTLPLSPFYCCECLLQVEKFKEAVLAGGISLEEVEDQPYAEDEVGTDYDNPVKRPIDLDKAII